MTEIPKKTAPPEPMDERPEPKPDDDDTPPEDDIIMVCEAGSDEESALKRAPICPDCARKGQKIRLCPSHQTGARSYYRCHECHECLSFAAAR